MKDAATERRIAGYPEWVTPLAAAVPLSTVIKVEVDKQRPRRPATPAKMATA